MMSSPALLHMVSSVAPCCCVAGHCNGACQVAHSAGVVLQSHCSYPPDCAASLELLNHSILWQTTVSALQAYVMLAQSYNPLATLLAGAQRHPCHIMP
jgi:hypothetical protein